MRMFKMLWLVLVLGFIGACNATPTPTEPVTRASPPTAPPSTPSLAVQIEPAPSPTPLGYPVPLPPTLPGGYPAPLTPFPSPSPISYPLPAAPSPPPTLSPTPLPQLRVVPTPSPAPNAIAPENAAALRPLARITPPSREGFEGGVFPSGPIWDVAFSNDESHVAIGKPDGVFVYDLAASKPLRYIDTGTAFPIQIYFAVDNRTLITSSGGDVAPFGATFFDIATGQRQGRLRVPWPAMPHIGTRAYPSPDGRILVVQRGQAARFHDMQTLQPLGTWPEGWFPATAIAFSPDSRLAAISFNGVAVWEVETGKLLFRPTPPDTTTTQKPLAAFSPDGRLLATADGRTLRVWDMWPPQEKFHIALDGFYANSLAFSPDGQKLSVATETQVSVWSAQTGERLLLTTGYAPQFSPDSARLVTQSGDAERVSVWDIPSPGPQARFTLDGNSPQFTPDGRLLVQVITNTYAFADANTGALSSTFAAQRVHVLRDGRLLDVRDDGSIRLLEAGNGQPLVSLALRAQPGPATGVLFLGEGQLVISSGNGTVRRDAIVDEDPYNVPPTAEQGGWIYQIALAPDSKTLSTASKDGSLLYLGGGDFSLFSVPTFGGPPGELTSVAFSPDGLWLAAGSSNGAVKVWDSTQPAAAPIRMLSGHTSWVWGVAYSPDGKRIASASADKTVRVWDAITGSPLLTLTGHTEAVRSVAFAPDGRLILSAAWDGTLKLWDSDTGELRRTLTGHTGKVNRAVFSRDRRAIASASADGTVRLWDTATGRELSVLNADGGPVWDVAFSWDGTQLAAALDDGTVQIWSSP